MFPNKYYCLLKKYIYIGMFISLYNYKDYAIL